MKQLVSIRIDADILAFFRAQGPGYQTRISEVLRDYVEIERDVRALEVMRAALRQPQERPTQEGGEG